MEAREIEKIVAALRCTGLSEKCVSCDYGYHLCQDNDCNDACDNEMLDKDAAAAIEDLQAEVRKYHDAFGRLSKTAVELEQRIAELKGVKPQEVQE